MSNMHYKDFEGSAEIDTETLICRGKVLFIDDLVTYKANSPTDLVREFQAAVDDYLETCAQVGKSPQKPCKGQFNVRVAPELHRQAQRRATEENSSLNAVVTRALERFLNISTPSEFISKGLTRSQETPTFGVGRVVVVVNTHTSPHLKASEPQLLAAEGGSSSLTKEVTVQTGSAYVH